MIFTRNNYYSIASYGIIFRGNSSNSKKIITLQERIIRIVVGAHHRTSCRRLFKKLEILTVPSQYIHWLMSFFIGNQESFQTNSSVHSINTRNKHHPHRPIANLSCFQKGASYSGIRIFNSLPRSITSLKNEKTQFKVALKILKCTFLLLCGWIFRMYRWHVLLTYMMFIISYTVIFYICLWHVPHSVVLWQSQGSRDCIYLCMLNLSRELRWKTMLHTAVVCKQSRHLLVYLSRTYGNACPLWSKQPTIPPSKCGPERKPAPVW